MANTLANLIHIARIFEGGTWRYLLLRKGEDKRYGWFWKSEEATGISADSAEEAIRLARREWKDRDFTTVNCGFRFTLPERDEIGGNALFHQMVASYSSSNGVYVDEELGFQCIVHDASAEARDLWAKFS